MSRFAAAVDPLTRTEIDVLVLVVTGLSNQEIAATLSVTVGTVKCHLHRVYDKLQVTSRLAAAVAAREHAELSSLVATKASVRAPAVLSNFGFSG